MLALVFGAASTVSAETSVARFALFFGLYVAADGILSVAGALRRTACGVPAWCLLTRGLSGIVVGVVTVYASVGPELHLYPVLTAWALLAGLFEIVTGVCAWRRLDGDMYQIQNGAVTVVLGVVLLLIPPSGLSALIPLISLYAVMAGTLLLFLGIRTDLLRSRPTAQDFSAAPF